MISVVSSERPSLFGEKTCSCILHRDTKEKKRWGSWTGLLASSDNKGVYRQTDLCAALDSYLCSLSFVLGCARLAVNELPCQGITMGVCGIYSCHYAIGLLVGSKEPGGGSTLE